MENVVIDWLSGFCPVQAEGTVDGLPFYFRARGRHWRIGIGGDCVMEPTWGYGESYGTGPFDAGCMPEDEATGFIEKAIGLYRCELQDQAI
ncbi:hypothetical protein GOB57_10090 [Sinorhizobium meliloti]|nr:hypothetical protein [Sinorhizobium meliloti]